MITAKGNKIYKLESISQEERDKIKPHPFGYLYQYIQDKDAIMNCIRNKGDLKQLLIDRNIKLANPINTITHG